MIWDVAAYLAFFLVIALNYSLLCLGLNLQWGFTGLFNVGVVGFFAIGAYTSAILTSQDVASRIGGFELPVALGWLGAMAVSGAAAMVVGLATLRLRHDYLAIATFGIAVTVQLLALNLQPLTGGAFGISFIPRPLFEHFDDPAVYNAFYLLLELAILGLVYLALETLVRSPWGRLLMAIREDEVAASSLGKNPFAVRMQAFVIGSMIMGLAGALYCNFIGFVAPDNFLPILTFQVWTMLIVGGSGSNRGAVLGGVLVWALWSASGALLGSVVPAEFQVRAAALQIVLIGVALVAMLMLWPQGIWGGRERSATGPAS